MEIVSDKRRIILRYFESLSDFVLQQFLHIYGINDIIRNGVIITKGQQNIHADIHY